MLLGILGELFLLLPQKGGPCGFKVAKATKNFETIFCIILLLV